MVKGKRLVESISTIATISANGERPEHLQTEEPISTTWTFPLQYGAIYDGETPAVVTCGPMDKFLWGGIQQALREGGGTLPYTLKRFANISTGLVLLGTTLWSFLYMVAALSTMGQSDWFVLQAWIGGTMLTGALGALATKGLYHHYYAEKIGKMQSALEQQLDQFSQDYAHQKGFIVAYEKPERKFWSRAHIRVEQLQVEVKKAPENGLDKQDKALSKDEFVFPLVASPWTRSHTPIDACTYGAIVETWMPIAHSWERQHMFGFLLVVVMGARLGLSFIALVVVLLVYQKLTDLYFCSEVLPRANQTLQAMSDQMEERCGYRAEIFIPDLDLIQSNFSQAKLRLSRSSSGEP
eukprot:CAMPEP_0168742448 /NCGR_PEP_ID=MMETSP0724-20121128/13041_1 /TAXON_ID=265536 /ORGANISM="Amphiprora sp., Strain CCMP467" /LENGTH=352 /DNA_ID=CAMNT_0008789997 /DNA_START=35 /DNA_END=1093 /DNA_ORIENTATION=-